MASLEPSALDLFTTPQAVAYMRKCLGYGSKRTLVRYSEEAGITPNLAKGEGEPRIHRYRRVELDLMFARAVRHSVTDMGNLLKSFEAALSKLDPPEQRALRPLIQDLASRIR